MISLVLIASGFTYQISVNRIVRQDQETFSVFIMSGHIKEALIRAERLSSSPKNGILTELKLRLAPDNTELGRTITFEYIPKIEDSSGLLSIGTEELTFYGMGKLNLARNMEELFRTVEVTQACARGFHVELTDQTGAPSYPDTSLIGEKTLADGRQMKIYKENKCSHDDMDTFGEYLMLTESI